MTRNQEIVLYCKPGASFVLIILLPLSYFQIQLGSTLLGKVALWSPLHLLVFQLPLAVG